MTKEKRHIRMKGIALIAEAIHFSKHTSQVFKKMTWRDILCWVEKEFAHANSAWWNNYLEEIEARGNRQNN